MTTKLTVRGTWGTPQALLCCVVIGWLAMAGSALAQYKSVDASGTVTYSDRPPPATSRILNEKKSAAAVANPPLPFALQQAASKYPVTLYTGDKCSPCDDARGYLRNRGVPFTEKTVTSDDDIAAFKQQSPDGTAPVILVGSRRTSGFSANVVGGLLDSAGYPQTSTMPRDYQNPAPTPLVASTKPAAQPASAATTGRGTTQTAQETPRAPSAPPGFRF